MPPILRMRTRAPLSWDEASKPKSVREEMTWVIPVRFQLGCSDDARTGCHRRRGSCGFSGRGVAAPAWLCRAHLPAQRRGASAVSAAAAVQGLSEGRGTAGQPDVPAGQILSRPEHRADRRSRRLDRSRRAQADARLRRLARLRAPGAGDRRAQSPARYSQRQSRRRALFADARRKRGAAEADRLRASASS